MSREKAKLSYRWKAAVIERWAVSRGRLVWDEETGEPFRVPCCPGCTAQVVDKDGVPLTDEDLNRRKRNCVGCGSPLWQADRSGPARYPLADYVKHRMRGFFDLLIGDEIHEFKSRGSAQGIAAGILADVCGRSLSLSGTLMGRYASTLFHLLYRCSPEIRTDFGPSDEHRWIQRMDDFLTRHGFRVAVMKADAVAPDRREAWVADRVKQGVDVLICHTRLVQTGLDLVDFPTICWAETDYSGV